MFDAQGNTFKGCIVIEPPHPVLEYVYRCDKVFHVDSILRLYETPEVYGLIWITGSECKWYEFYLQGGRIHSTCIRKKSVQLAKHHKKGGQSQARIGRLHDESHHNYLTLMSDYTAKIFLRGDRPSIQGLILAGNGRKKEQLEKKLDSRLKSIVLGSISRGEEAGLFEACTPLIATSKQNQEEKLVQDFMTEFDRESTSIVYGREYVRQAMGCGKVKMLLLHEKVMHTLNITEDKLNRIRERCIRERCSLYIIQIVSPITQRFIDLGGLGGILWYPNAMEEFY
jgi:peptide chain release factor subunit 1